MPRDFSKDYVDWCFEAATVWADPKLRCTLDEVCKIAQKLSCIVIAKLEDQMGESATRDRLIEISTNVGAVCAGYAVTGDFARLADAASMILQNVK